MIKILVVLIVSWVILNILQKKSLLSLGFLPVGIRSKQFLTGFLMAAIVCIVVLFLEGFLKSISYTLNENLSFIDLVKQFWSDLKSVVGEELIFRGALLYILINRLGRKIALLITAIVFGIYHWFLFEVLGSYPEMAIVFIGTGIMGYVLALAFLKTGSIMMPIGIHLGWNYINNALFSKGYLGKMILIPQGGNELSDWTEFLFFISTLAMGYLIILLILHFLSSKKMINNISNLPIEGDG